MGISIEDFIEDCRSRGLTEHTLQTYKSNVTAYLAFIGDPLKVDTPILCNFLNYLKEDMEYRVGRVTKKGVCLKTVGSIFVAISTFYEYLVYTRQIDQPYTAVPEALPFKN